MGGRVTLRLLGLLAAATALALAPSQCPVSAAARAAAPQAVGFPTRPTRVLALGDSVMEGAAGTIPAALPGREVTVDTEVSRSTGDTASAAAAHGADWDVVVIFVGHNDGGSAAAYQPPYRQMLDHFGAVPRVVVVTIHEVRPYYPGVNAFLRAEAGARPNVRVADWNAVANANPGSTAGDGLHLTNGGARLFAAMIADVVALTEAEAAPPPPPPTTTPPTTTTTTAPPTTTSTTSSTTSTTSTTTAPPATVPPAATKPPRRAPAALPRATGGDAVPVGVWPGLAAAMALVTMALRSLGRSLPV